MLHEGQSQIFEVPTSDQRRLSVETSGDEGGIPVLLLHGTPGSRQGPRPRESVLFRLGIRLISYDRPGYGGSTRKPGRRVVDTVADVLAIMDFFGHRTFAVVGRSGGAPHALACAAKCPDRVSKAAALVSVAPADADGLNWFDGMTDINVDDFGKADDDAATLSRRLQSVAKRTRRNPESILDDLQAELTAVDQRMVHNVGLRRLLASAYKEALRHGADGWVDDVLAIRTGWGFDLSDIAVPVMLWHGEEDNLSPVAHTQWLADRIKNRTLCIQPGSAHFGAVAVLPKVLSWVASSDDRVNAEAFTRPLSA